MTEQKVDTQLAEEDVSNIHKILDCISSLAEPTMLGDEYMVFYNETLNMYIVELFEMLDNISEDDDISKYMDNKGTFGFRVGIVY